MNRRRPVAGPDLPDAIGFLLCGVLHLLWMIPAAYALGVL